eukprot:Nk52_evm40s252 gene=Nk52_evmTU40s252
MGNKASSNRGSVQTLSNLDPGPQQQSTALNTNNTALHQEVEQDLGQSAIPTQNEGNGVDSSHAMPLDVCHQQLYVKNDEKIETCISKLLGSVFNGNHELLESRLHKYINRYTSWTFVLRPTGEDILKQKTKRPGQVEYSRFVDARGEHGRTLLYIAACRGYEKCMVTLIKLGADITLCDDFGVSPLYISATKGYTNCVRLLVKNGAPIDICSSSGWHLINRCVRGEKVGCLRILLEAMKALSEQQGEICTFEVKDETGFQPLHFAAGKYANVECVELLLSFGCKVDCVNERGYTPFHLACGKYCRRDIASILLKHGADIHKRCKEGFKPIHMAIQYGRYEGCVFLLESLTLLETVVEEPNDEPNFSLKQINEGYDNNMYELTMTSKHDAEDEFGSNSSLPPLVDSNCSIVSKPVVINAPRGKHRKLKSKGKEFKGIFPSFGQATSQPRNARRSSSKEDWRKRFLETRTSFSGAGMTPLYYAVSLGHKNIALYLLDQGANVNSLYVRTENTEMTRSRSVLAQACANACPELVALLLDYGADPNLKDTWAGQYPIETLVNSCKKINGRHSRRNTRSTTITEKGICECLDLLVECGAILRSGALNHFIEIAKRESCKKVAKHIKKVWQASEGIPTLLNLARSKMRQHHKTSLLTLRELQEESNFKTIPTHLLEYINKPMRKSK